jgi:hypothetical protein
VGFFAGASYEQVASKIGTGSAIVIGVLIVVALAVWHVRRRRHERVQEERYDDEATAAAGSREATDGVGEPGEGGSI